MKSGLVIWKKGKNRMCKEIVCNNRSKLHYVVGYCKGMREHSAEKSSWNNLLEEIAKHLIIEEKEKRCN